MKFGELSAEQLVTKIQIIHDGISCQRMDGTAFYSITPKQNKNMALKSKYKLASYLPGKYTQQDRLITGQNKLIKRANNKLMRNGFDGMPYYNEDASLKLHLNLNNIGEIEETVLLGLISLLIKASELENNNLNFHFKIIEPDYHLHARFKDTDQITIYFDRYSSTGEAINLSSKIAHYLYNNGITKNEVTLGPKDSFSFNSFVSARFDSSRILAKYDVYPFFDLELKKFFEFHSKDNLDEIPLGAFEAVFNIIIISSEIMVLRSNSNNELEEVDSKKVQREFNKMLLNPLDYINQSNKKINQLQRKTVTEYMNLLKKLEEKSKKLTKEGYPEKGAIAKEVHEKLKREFQLFQSGRISYNSFKATSKSHIKHARPLLASHRGLKQVFVNALVLIATLGVGQVYNYIQSEGKHFFFQVNTDSVNQLDKLEKSINKKLIP